MKEMEYKIAEKSEIFSGSIQYVTICFVNEKKKFHAPHGRGSRIPL